MPNIRQYSPQVDGIRPDERGVDAALTVARRGGSLFDQAADAVRTVGNQFGAMLGSGIRAAGDVAVDYVTTREVSQGAAAFTSLQQRVRDQWNETAKTADPNDPTVAARFREKVLEPEIEKFGEQFMTDGGRKFAQSHLASLRDSLVNTMTADMSTLASSAVAVNMKQTGNALSSTAATDPSTVPTLLAQADSLVGSIIESTPNLKGATAAKARMEMTQRTKEDIVKSGAVAAIAKSGNPEAEADLWTKKYPEYLSGSDAKALAANARQQIRAARIDAAYLDKVRDAETQDLSDKRVDEYMKDLYSGDPQKAAAISARNIVNDPTLTRRDKDYMLARVERVMKPETDAQRSAATTTDLLSRMQAPEGSPERITDIQPIYDEFKKGNLSRTDTDWLIKQFRESRTPEGSRLTDSKADLMKAVGPQLDTTTMFKLDTTGAMNKYRFQKDADAAVEAYRKSGKNPYDLFDPSKPDFLGRPDNVARYQKSMAESARDVNKRLLGRDLNITGPGKTVTGIEVTPAPVIEPRKPGESAADYLKRTKR